MSTKNNFYQNNLLIIHTLIDPSDVEDIYLKVRFRSHMRFRKKK